MSIYITPLPVLVPILIVTGDEICIKHTNIKIIGEPFKRFSIKAKYPKADVRHSQQTTSFFKKYITVEITG